jgi:ectoine hydroxylase-related dioxygenase (phytanoyl-CoA dioxygenase family)
LSIEHLSAETSGAKVAEALARDGCVVVDHLAPTGSPDRILEEMAPFMEVARPGEDIYSGMHTRRTGALVARSPTARELVMHPLVLDTMRRVLGHATGFQLHITQIITLEPGERAQPIHRDQWVFNRFPFPAGFEVQCGTLWALTDFTEQNGATRLLPGSHLLDDRNEVPEIEGESVPAEMEAGSVLFYTGSVHHGAGANATDAPRHGLNITYDLSWLRQEENQYLAVPPEIARTLPEPLLRLIGYAPGGYSLGYIDGQRDPIEVLRA